MDGDLIWGWAVQLGEGDAGREDMQTRVYRAASRICTTANCIEDPVEEACMLLEAVLNPVQWSTAVLPPLCSEAPSMGTMRCIMDSIASSFSVCPLDLLLAFINGTDANLRCPTWEAVCQELMDVYEDE